ncbi:hypothetical protein QR680_015530 [Steinernema hermaphroditum]|uniref:Uncharacterized protein n=1 Tax=Steinernema hermaphroditum TaxID=289476 RepID=A0AA39LKE5_9BILA|nr:hypothetical protein QR680_015530 [Steinernema hermaphroditum]
MHGRALAPYVIADIVPQEIPRRSVMFSAIAAVILICDGLLNVWFLTIIFNCFKYMKVSESRRYVNVPIVVP